MQYAILGYQSDEAFSVIANPDRALRQGFKAYVDAVKAAGVFVFGVRLESPESATTLRTQGNKRVVQDGPQADTKKHLGGLLVIQAPNPESAIEWATCMPPILGRVYETRPTPAYGS